MSLFIAAVAASGCSEKDAALSIGCPDASYWSKVKSGEKPAPRIDRLTDAPEAVQREMCRRWARQLRMRVTDDDTRALVLAELMEVAARAMREIA